MSRICLPIFHFCLFVYYNRLSCVNSCNNKQHKPYIRLPSPVQYTAKMFFSHLTEKLLCTRVPVYEFVSVCVCLHACWVLQITADYLALRFPLKNLSASWSRLCTQVFPKGDTFGVKLQKHKTDLSKQLRHNRTPTNKRAWCASGNSQIHSNHTPTVSEKERIPG